MTIQMTASPRYPDLGQQVLSEDNLLLMTDSYKNSHHAMFPAGMTRFTAYLEARGGALPATVFFGLQYACYRYLSQPVTEAQVHEAADIAKEHGVPFNKQGWLRIAREFGGRLPLEIRAVPEGTSVPLRNVLMTVTNTHDDFAWLVGWMETLLQRAVWYPTTVASISRYCRDEIIAPALRVSCDDPEGQLPFRLHDFGARGVSSGESAALGGAAHLLSFLGSDTMEALRLARNYYGANMAGFSIPAAEHNTIISWGKAHEADAYRNMLRAYAREGSVLAIVADSYDLKNAVTKIFGEELRGEIIASGATVVIRPDSGNPVDMVRMTLGALESRFGTTTNSLGYKVLNHVRVIQGDGITPESLREIVQDVLAQGFSLENVAFGMGGGLLQKVDRDTLRFAYKGSAALIDGAVVPIYKDPITDPGKRSKDGVLDLVKVGGRYQTVRFETFEAAEAARDQSSLQTVYRDGVFGTPQGWDDIRNR